MLTTDQKGGVAEMSIAMAAIKIGTDVYKPVVEGGRHDLIFEVETRLFRVQCKWAPLQGELSPFGAIQLAAGDMDFSDVRIRLRKSI